MKIQYVSDLHLEFHDNWRYLRSNPLIPSADVLVLAGDIGYIGDDNYSKHPFWDWVSANFKECYVVPGNHEFYKGFDLSNMHDGFTLDIRPNVHSVYNKVVRIGDTDLILSTLWAKISLQDAFATERAISDFHRIKLNGEIINFSEFNKLHEQCRAFIEKAVAESSAEKIVVASHHVPSFELVSPDFKGSALNGAFTVELGNFIADSRINYWIYGHSHRNIDTQIGNTQIVSNQLGYICASENVSFRHDAVIDL